jgi:hypothetical protein
MSITIIIIIKYFENEITLRVAQIVETEQLQNCMP